MSAQKIYKIVWLKKALCNFDDEITYIAKDDLQAARQVAKRILQAVDLLATHPSMGVVGRIHGTRELIVAGTRYILPYRVSGSEIRILRVFHASRKSPIRW